MLLIPELKKTNLAAHLDIPIKSLKYILKGLKKSVFTYSKNVDYPGQGMNPREDAADEEPGVSHIMDQTEYEPLTFTIPHIDSVT